MTPTPNPTAEQIVAEAMVDAGAPIMHSRVEEAVVAALRAHGLLAEGAPSEELEKLRIWSHRIEGLAGLMIYRGETLSVDEQKQIAEFARFVRAALTAMYGYVQVVCARCGDRRSGR